MTASVDTVAGTRTVCETLAQARRRLHAAGVATPQLDAELLLAHACGWTRTRLIAATGDELPAVAERAFTAALARRVDREPLAYIVGHQEFWSLNFEVSPAVLIPRPETELVVEYGLELLAGRSQPRIADVGTGSGCIAIALARELPNAIVWATDVSDAALAVARRNAQRVGVSERIRFAAGDLLTPLADAAPFDLICSNPPYVALGDADSLQCELRYEPVSALFAGADGLAAIRRLLADSPALLVPGGALVMEIGFGQAAVVRELAGAAFASVSVRNDYAGIPRVVVGIRGR